MFLAERGDRLHGAALAHQLGVLCRRQIPFRGQQQHAAPEGIIRTASVSP
jgi:hypothetical protein